MKLYRFTGNEQWETGVSASNQDRFISYSGNLGGGGLRIYTKTHEELGYVPIPDALLDNKVMDSSGNIIRQFSIKAVGWIMVEMNNAVNPDVFVAVV